MQTKKKKGNATQGGVVYVRDKFVKEDKTHRKQITNCR